MNRILEIEYDGAPSGIIKVGDLYRDKYDGCVAHEVLAITHMIGTNSTHLTLYNYMDEQTTEVFAGTFLTEVNLANRDGDFYKEPIQEFKATAEEVYANIDVIVNLGGMDRVGELLGYDQSGNEYCVRYCDDGCMSVNWFNVNMLTHKVIEPSLDDLLSILNLDDDDLGKKPDNVLAGNLTCGGPRTFVNKNKGNNDIYDNQMAQNDFDSIQRLMDALPSYANYANIDSMDNTIVMHDRSGNVIFEHNLDEEMLTFRTFDVTLHCITQDVFVKGRRDDSKTIRPGLVEKVLRDGKPGYKVD
jgi:hypothetical protein